jgi:hypothetical protein
MAGLLSWLGRVKILISLCGGHWLTAIVGRFNDETEQQPLL